MKSDLLQAIVYLIAVVAIAWFIVQAFDVIEYEDDPSTGRRKVKLSKNRMLEGPTPLTLEGE